MRRSGFTLFELLVVIGILAILSSIVFAGLGTTRLLAKKKSTELILDKVDAALRTFRGEMGFYPRPASAMPPLKHQTGGFNAGLVQMDAATGLPMTDNDAIWAPNGTPTTWAQGNGLYSSIGMALTDTDRTLLTTNANILRNIEMDRYYHIGNFGNTMCDGLSVPPGFVTAKTNYSVTDPTAMRWAHLDAIGPTSLGERELKRVFDHFRMSPVVLLRNNVVNQYAVSPIIAETSASSSQIRTNFQSFLVQLFPIYNAYARPRDMSDAYMRVLRDGVEAGSVTYDSITNGSGVAQGAGMVSKTVSVTTSTPWHDDYLSGQFDRKLCADVDGDGNIDILDAYGRPLVYLDEGLPARPRINARLASISNNPLITNQSPNHIGILNNPVAISTATWTALPASPPGDNRSNYTRLYAPDPDDYISNYFGGGVMLMYHPDPDSEPNTIIPGGFSGKYQTSWGFVTDKANSRGVPVRADAPDISLVDYGMLNSGGSLGSVTPSAWANSGILQSELGDPYWLAGTLTPSRIAVRSTPTNNRARDTYFCSSKDGRKLVEPWKDLNGNGQWDAGEPYFDCVRNGSYDADAAAMDARISAPLGEEREFELLSAGRDGLYHAVRADAANLDNMRPSAKKR